MPIFKYKSRDNTGKLLIGTVEAKNEHEAATLIRERQLLLIDLREQQIIHLTLPLFSFRHRIRFNDIVNFTRQLSTMITAGLQIQDTLTLLKNQSTNPAFIELVGNVSREIRGGGNLTQALSKYPKYFSPTYLALVRAGESSGSLDKILERLAQTLEKQQELKRRVRSALLYPMIVFVAMVALFIFLLIFVIPKLADLYSQFELDLPPITQFIIDFSRFVQSNWYFLVAGVVVVPWLFQRWKSTKPGRKTYDLIKLKLPYVGGLLVQMMLVEFTRTMGMLVGAGVHILDTLNILINTMENVHFEESLLEIKSKVEKGFSLGVLFAQYPLFPPIVAQMVKIGEETGKMDETLSKLSAFFEAESDHTIKNLTTFIEPVFIIMLAIGIAFIFFAVFIPIFKLTSSIG
ncbi:type II secretion system F family protein [Candidatus Gottesmanbacteria bacterium]|nr:type II secretion system F family protein [Candidatus Gottesmanbacteria bacterium]